MARSWLCAGYTLAVCIAMSIPHRAQSLNNRLATAKDLLEQLLGMLAWREIELLRRQRVKFGKVGAVIIGLTRRVQYMLAYRLKERTRGRNRAFRIIGPAL
jgi:hypothetical protein